MKEKIMIEVERIRDKHGQPSCAFSFSEEDFEVCEFYRTQIFGCHETCLFALENNGIGQKLKRRKGGLGTLIPGDWCPLWREKK